VQKVKGRFPPSVYLQFLKILRDFEDKQATITEVEDKLSVLFHGHNDLLEEFGTFLPDDMRGKTLKRKEDTNEEGETDCGVIDSEVIAFLCSHANLHAKLGNRQAFAFSITLDHCVRIASDVRAVPDPWCSWQVLAHLAQENRRTGHPIIRISSAGVLIGRGSDAERAEAAEAGLVYVHVGPRHVSAKHCRIFKRDGKWLLQQEASSKNGIPCSMMQRGVPWDIVSQPMTPCAHRRLP
jgi:hypothetical protein